MKHASLGALALLCIGTPVWAVSSTTVTPDSQAPTLARHITVDYRTGQIVQQQFAPAGTVYDNTSSPANAAFSSTNLAAIFGDHVLMTGTGNLSGFSFAIYNSDTSAGNYTGSGVSFKFYRYADSSLMGGFTDDITPLFSGSPLPPGYYDTITITGLDGLGINLDTTDAVITQQLTNVTGDTDAMGFVSMDPVTIGSSSASFYMNDPSKGAAGFYSFTGGPPANLAYQVVVPEPASAMLLGTGVLGLLVRRRRA